MSLKLYDNSRMSDHFLCNRYYYWRHIRHLRAVGKQAALDFGSAWHDAMDVVWRGVHDASHLDDADLATVAHDAFMQTWTARGHPDMDEMSEEDARFVYKARNPDTAYFLLLNYIRKRRSFIEEVKLLEVEQPFAVPVDTEDTETFYVGRVDKRVEWNNRVWFIEHKTTSWGTAKSGVNGVYIESYSPNSQIDGYLHAGHMLYGDKFKGVLVDIALVLNNHYEHFVFHPVERSINNLDAWLWELKREIQLEQLNRRELEKISKNDPFMASFPKCTKNCIQFMRPCQFMDICKSIENPQKEPDRVPMGYKVDKWSPFNEIKLEKLGMKREGEEL